MIRNQFTIRYEILDYIIEINPDGMVITLEDGRTVELPAELLVQLRECLADFAVKYESVLQTMARMN